MVIDIECHLWDRMYGIFKGLPFVLLDDGNYKWGNKVIKNPNAYSGKSSTPEMLLNLMDSVGVDMAVLLQAPVYGYLNDYVLNVCQQYPDKFVPSCILENIWGRASGEELRACVERGFKCLKLEVEHEEGHLQTVPDWKANDSSTMYLWEAICDTDTPVFIHIGGHDTQIDELCEVLEKFPELKLILLHMGLTQVRFQGDEPHFVEQIARLFTYRNVYLGLTGLPIYFEYFKFEDYPYPSCQKLLRRFYEEVGAERMLWGSDYPGTLNVATYAQCLTMFTHQMDYLEPGELEQILGGNAARLFGLQETEESKRRHDKAYLRELVAKYSKRHPGCSAVELLGLMRSAETVSTTAREVNDILLSLGTSGEDQ